MQGFVPVRPSALCSWAARTAALTSRFPRPEQGIESLRYLKLATTDRGGRLVPCTELLRCPTQSFTPERLPARLSLVVLERLLASDETKHSILQALGHVEASQTELLISIRLLADAADNPAWSWLQQLSLAAQRGDFLAIDERLRPFVVFTERPPRRPLSAAELQLRLAEQSARAAMAERYVVECERDRLRDHGCRGLAEDVQLVSVCDVSAGFDIASFNVDGSRRLIEVKSSAGPRDSFFLSANELAAARTHRDAYWIAWVGWAYRLPSGPCELAWFRDPSGLLNDTGAWRVSPATLEVSRVADDSAYMTPA